MPTVENCEYTEVRCAAGPISWYAGGEGIGDLVSAFFYWRNLSSFFMAKLAVTFPGEIDYRICGHSKSSSKDVGEDISVKSTDRVDTAHESEECADPTVLDPLETKYPFRKKLSTRTFVDGDTELQ